MQYLPYIATAFCLAISYPISKLLKISFWNCLGVSIIAGIAAFFLPKFFEYATSFYEILMVTSFAVVIIALLAVIVNVVISLIIESVRQKNGDDFGSAKSGGGIKARLAGHGDAELTQEARQTALRISRNELVSRFNGRAETSSSSENVFADREYGNEVPRSTFVTQKKNTRQRRQTEALFDLALVSAKYEQDKQAATENDEPVLEPAVRSDPLFDFNIDEIDDIPDLPDYDIPPRPPEVKPVKGFEPLKLERVVDLSAPVAPASVAPVPDRYAAMASVTSVSQPDYGLYGINDGTVSEPWTVPAIAAETAPEPSETEPVSEAAPPPPKSTMSAPFRNALEKAYRYMEQNRWSDAAEVFEFTRMLQGTGEQKKSAELELINCLIRAGRKNDATDAAFALLTSGQELNETERSLLRNLLEELQI